MMTPSVLDLLLDIHDAQASKALKSLRYITTVGEPLRSTLAHRVMSSKNLSVSLRNFYGASESSCHFEIDLLIVRCHSKVAILEGK